MGIFGPFKCAYCGRTFKGLSWDIKNGKVVCGKCYDELSKLKPYNEWHKMTITQIKEFTEEKARLVAQKECSYCGKPFDASDICKLVLKDKSQICSSCVEKLRMGFRVFCTEEKQSDTGQFVPAFDDPITELTLSDLPSAMEFAEAEHKARLEKYGDCKSVFIVDDVIRIKDRNDIQQHIIWGRQVLGSTGRGDVLCIKRREMPYYISVSDLKLPKYNEKAERLLEGHDGGLEVPEDVSFIYPGDILIIEKDRWS